FRFLGVHTEESMSWSANTSELLKKAQQRLCFLRIFVVPVTMTIKTILFCNYSVLIFYQNPSYNFRTRLFVDQLINGNVSLKVSRVNSSDTGKYRCYLPSIHQEVKKGSVTLIDKHKEVSLNVFNNTDNVDDANNEDNQDSTNNMAADWGSNPRTPVSPTSCRGPSASPPHAALPCKDKSVC
uniref:Alkylated DNA repair protein AlkB homologue 8 N-terminal domain-containing protein n=1 Tax=Anabas testudineus TaxID=64144 RepID=A0AAQ6IIW6_ANATE